MPITTAFVAQKHYSERRQDREQGCFLLEHASPQINDLNCPLLLEIHRRNLDYRSRLARNKLKPQR